jgi:hypothetical protein
MKRILALGLVVLLATWSSLLEAMGRMKGKK